MSDTPTPSPTNSDLLHDLLQAGGRNKRRQRLGRGEGSKGKTAGRGQKGAGSRAGKPKRQGFEGGQTEIYRRFPQRGFSNKPFETKYHVVNLQSLARFDEGTEIDARALRDAGLIPNHHLGVKVLGFGTLDKKLVVKADAYSRSAHKAIGEAGGSAFNVDGQPYEFVSPVNRRQKSKLDKRLDRLGLAEPSSEATPSAPSDGDAGSNADADVRSNLDADTGSNDDAVTQAPESGEPQA